MLRSCFQTRIKPSSYLNRRSLMIMEYGSKANSRNAILWTGGKTALIDVTLPAEDVDNKNLHFPSLAEPIFPFFISAT